MAILNSVQPSLSSWCLKAKTAIFCHKNSCWAAILNFIKNQNRWASTLYQVPISCKISRKSVQPSLRFRWKHMTKMFRCALKMAAERPFWMISKNKIDGHQLHTKGQYHAKYQENRSSHLWDLGGDGRTHGRTDGAHSYIPRNALRRGIINPY